MIHRLPVLVAEFGFFVLAYVALSFAFCDFVDGVGGYQVEAVVAAIAAASGVLVDLLEHVRRRRMVQGAKRFGRAGTGRLGCERRRYR